MTTDKLTMIQNFTGSSDRLITQQLTRLWISTLAFFNGESIVQPTEMTSLPYLHCPMTDSEAMLLLPKDPPSFFSS